MHAMARRQGIVTAPRRVARHRSGLATFVGLLAGFLAAGGDLQARDDKPTEGDRAAIESVAKEILVRVDSAEAIQQNLTELEIAARKAVSAADNAEKEFEIAEIALSEYRQGGIPQERQTAEGEIKLAESELERAKERSEYTERLLKRGSTTESQVLADRMSRQKAEISLANARKKQEVLEKYTIDKNTTALAAKIRASQSRMLERRAEAIRANRQAEQARRTQSESQLTKEEAAAVIALDESIRLLEAGQAEPSRAALAKATKAWRDEQDRRARVRFDGIKARVRDLAEKARAGR